MLKFIHVLALVASLFDHDAHAHGDHDSNINLILANVNSRRAIARS